MPSLTEINESTAESAEQYQAVRMCGVTLSALIGKKHGHEGYGHGHDG